MKFMTHVYVLSKLLILCLLLQNNLGLGFFRDENDTTLANRIVGGSLGVLGGPEGVENGAKYGLIHNKQAQEAYEKEQKHKQRRKKQESHRRRNNKQKENKNRSYKDEESEDESDENERE
jgi:hypothetical protein